MSGDFWRKLRVPWLDRGDIETEIDDELAFHMEMRTRELIEAGVDPERAQADAAHAFGDAAATRDGYLSGRRRQVRRRRVPLRCAALRPLSFGLGSWMLLSKNALIAMLAAGIMASAEAAIEVPPVGASARFKVQELGTGWHRGFFNQTRTVSPCYILIIFELRSSSKEALRIKNTISITRIQRLQVTSADGRPVGVADLFTTCCTAHGEHIIRKWPIDLNSDHPEQFNKAS